MTTVIGLGGKEYRQAIEAAFTGTGARLRFPFAGLQIGKAMQAVKLAIENGDPFGVKKSTHDRESTQRRAISSGGR